MTEAETVADMVAAMTAAADHFNSGGGPAYPCATDIGYGTKVSSSGLSVRDWFAGRAMSMLDAEAILCDGGLNGATAPERIASLAYKIADAMLAQREVQS